MLTKVPLTEKVSFKEINRLALPAILAGISEPLLSLTDLAIVGHLKTDATEALAAVGIAGSFLSALIWILAQTKTAISAIVARYYGARKINRLKQFVSQAIFFNLLLSIIITILTYLLANKIFTLYEAEGKLLDYTVSYFKLRILGFPLTLITFSIFGVFRGLQNTSWAMWTSIAGTVLNVALDYAFVFGIKGLIPPMHIEGAAIASLIAQFAMLLIALYYLYRKTDFRIFIPRKLHPELSPMLLMSFNLFLRTAALNIAIYLASRYATSYGNEVIAAQAVLMNIWLFSAFFIDGYANAGNAISGKLLGAEEHQKLWMLGIDLSKFSVWASLFLVLVYSVGYYYWGALFIKDNSALNIFLNAFWIIILMQPINAIAFTFDGIFKGLGEAKFLRNLLMVATFIGFVPIIWLCDLFGLNIYGIWIAFTVWMLIRALGTVIRFKRKYHLK